jgi:hypothetical protein
MSSLGAMKKPWNSKVPKGMGINIQEYARDVNTHPPFSHLDFEHTCSSFNILFIPSILSPHDSRNK